MAEPLAERQSSGSVCRSVGVVNDNLSAMPLMFVNVLRSCLDVLSHGMRVLDSRQTKILAKMYLFPGIKEDRCENTGIISSMDIFMYPSDSPSHLGSSLPSNLVDPMSSDLANPMLQAR